MSHINFTGSLLKFDAWKMGSASFNAVSWQ